MKPRLAALLTLCAAICLSQSVFAADPGVIVAKLNVTSVNNGTVGVTLTIVDSGSGASTFLVQSSPSLQSPQWSREGNAIQPNASGTNVVTLPGSTSASKFYRALGLSGTASDADGDGLSDTFETSIGTNSFDPDSDGDGSFDGVEYSLGSSPLSAASTPGLTALPRAEFETASSSAAEGEGRKDIKIVFDKPYVGTLKYEVLPISVASAPADFLPLSGSVSVNGVEAYIPISLVDDLNIRERRNVCLQIVTDPAHPYARGGRSRHALSIADHDAWWTAILADKYAQRNLRVRMLRSGSVTQAIFAAGAGQDGLPTLASEAAGAQSSLSEGLVPAGAWPGVVKHDTASRFQIATPAMPASTGGLFGDGSGLARTLELNCQPSAIGALSFHEISKDRYIGSYTEVLAFPGAGGLGATNTGTFVLMRDIPPPSAMANPLSPR